jgi:hypothetical protein
MSEARLSRMPGDRRFQPPHVPSRPRDGAARMQFDLGQRREIAFDDQPLFLRP